MKLKDEILLRTNEETIESKESTNYDGQKYPIRMVSRRPPWNNLYLKM